MIKLLYWMILILACSLWINKISKVSSQELPNKIEPRLISIGLFYCDIEEFNKTEEILNELNGSQKSSKTPSRYKFNLKGIKLDKSDNMLTLSTTVCQNFINTSPMYAALVGSTHCLSQNVDDYILTKTAISFTCGFYQMPVIDLYSQEAAFSDKVKYFKGPCTISMKVQPKNFQKY